MATRFEYYITGAVVDGVSTTYGNKIRAQQFTPLTAHSIEFVKLLLTKHGSPPSNLVVEIQEVDEDGWPNGVILCSGITNSSTLPDYDNSEWRQVDFSVPVNLQANIKYIIVTYLENFDGNSNNNVEWAVDAVGATYPRGYRVFSTDKGETWFDSIDADALFEEWGTELVIGTGTFMINENWGW